jgi:hypothetical protein
MPNRFRKNGKGESLAPVISERYPPIEIGPRMEKETPAKSLAAEYKTADGIMQFILDHPGICLGTAITIGVLVGWLVKRR